MAVLNPTLQLPEAREIVRSVSHPAPTQPLRANASQVPEPLCSALICCSDQADAAVPHLELVWYALGYDSLSAHRMGTCG